MTGPFEKSDFIKKINQNRQKYIESLNRKIEATYAQLSQTLHEADKIPLKEKIYTLEEEIKEEISKFEEVKLSSPSILVYKKTFRECLADGIITNDERQILLALAREFKLSQYEVDQIENEVRCDIEKEIHSRGVDSDIESEPFTENLPEAAVNPKSETEADSTSGLENQEDLEDLEVKDKKLIQCWHETIPNPVVRVALFGSPLFVFVADETGNVAVYSYEYRRLIYTDHLEDKPFQISVLKDKVLVGTWTGHLYCFSSREVLWRTNFKSPISAIATANGKLEIAVGTWDGQVVVVNSDGKRQWSAKSDDGISSLAIASTGEFIAFSNYAGHLSLLDSEGKQVWTERMCTGLFKVFFTEDALNLLAVTYDGEVSRINIERQDSLWHHSLDLHPLDVDQAENFRRLLITSKEGQILIFNVGDNLNLANETLIPDLIQAIISPIAKDGHFIFGLSQQKGLFVLDSYQKKLSFETQHLAHCFALSSDGRHAVIGTTESFSLYRFAKPDLRVVSLTSLNNLRKGHSNQLKLSLKNAGELIAREIKINISGLDECTQINPPDQIEVNSTISVDLVVQANEDGAFPVHIELQYIDDMGIDHGTEHDQVINVVSD